jgi:hypothetical protein
VPPPVDHSNVRRFLFLHESRQQKTAPLKTVHSPELNGTTTNSTVHKPFIYSKINNFGLLTHKQGEILLLCISTNSGPETKRADFLTQNIRKTARSSPALVDLRGRVPQEKYYEWASLHTQEGFE